MADTESKDDLLQACIQDLHAARRVAAERLPGIAAAAGGELAPVLRTIRDDFAAEAEQLEATDHDLDGPENLWMAGIIDDAERDTRSIVRGPLLDTALIGAIRKGLAADVVSLETGVAVAQSLGKDGDSELLQEMHERSGQNDGRLEQLLLAIA